MEDNTGKFERDLDEGRVRVNQDGNVYSPTTWKTVNLEPIKTGDPRPGTEYLPRDDGRCLIYAGLPHTFYGESESLKSFAAVLAGQSFISSGLSVLYIDFEGDEWTIVERARIVGIPDAAIGRSFRYIRPTEKLGGNPNALSDLLIEETDLRPSLVILDGVSECYALHDWNINDAADAARFQKLFSNFADGTATIAIDHAGKDASRGVVGSQHKRAGLNGAEYLFTPKRREGRGGHSEASIKVTKDRHGYVREFAPHGTIGIIHVECDNEPIEPNRVYIAAPSYVESFGNDEALAAAILAAVGAADGLSGRKIADAVTGTATAIGDTVRQLAVEGKIRNVGTEARPKWVASASSASE